MDVMSAFAVVGQDLDHAAFGDLPAGAAGRRLIFEAHRLQGRVTISR
ncbi:hypothetical protein V5G24_21680 [Xanthobacter sp. VTT E-85241]